MKKPLLLIYGMTEHEKREGLKKLATVFSYDLKFVDDEDLHQHVGYLLSMEGFEAQPKADLGPIPNIDFVLLHQVPQEDHAKLFTYMKDHGLSTGNKAVVTDTNIRWPLGQLLKENDLEHRFMTLWQNLRRAIVFSENWQAQKGEDLELNRALLEAKEFEAPNENMDLAVMTKKYNQLVKEINRVLGSE